MSPNINEIYTLLSKFGEVFIIYMKIVYGTESLTLRCRSLSILSTPLPSVSPTKSWCRYMVDSTLMNL